jgi:hypothetical protein
MTQLLEVLKIVCFMIGGIFLSALLHGALSALPRGIVIMPATIIAALGFTLLLGDELKPYGFLSAGAIALGVILWIV